MKSAEMPGHAVRARYRCPANFLNFSVSRALSFEKGFFRFANATCYGRASSALCDTPLDSLLCDSLKDVVVDDSQVQLPFDPAEIIDNLRLERYPGSGRADTGYESLKRKLYYRLRPLTNRMVRTQIQRFHARNWGMRPFPRWPVDTTVENLCEKLLALSMEAQGVERLPFVWFWPKGASGCVVMTHDVENAAGRDFCPQLMDMDDSIGLKASFMIVPESRYALPVTFLDTIRNRGFEVGVQDLNHDGRLYDDRAEFLRRVELINRYGAEYAANGFRAAVLYRKLEWYDSLDFAFDMSVPNVSPLDPQRGGCCTVMPYFIGDVLELPVTTCQDYTLFHLLNQRSIDLWKTQIDLILGKNGMASFIIHPDYVIEPDTRAVFAALLSHLRDVQKKENVWFALPSEVNSWWRARSKMSVVRDNNSWRIEGDGAERALLAYAKTVDGKLIYEFTNAMKD